MAEARRRRFMHRSFLPKSVLQCEELETRRLFAGFAVTSLYGLDTSVGRSAQAAPAIDPSGNLFALTSAGGLNSDGTVFELPAGQHIASVIHAFTAASDPSTSYGNLVIDSNAHIYGTSFTGGVNHTGSIFQISPGNTYSTLYNFPTAPGIGSNLLGELTLFAPTPASPVLNFYGATSMGGDSNAGAVFQVTDSTSVTGKSLVGFPANYGVIGSGVTRDDAGDIFGTSTSGGTNNAGTIWEVPAGGGLFFSRASFSGTNGSDPLGPLLWDSKAGVFYGTTRFGGDNNDGTIFRFSNGTITTLASFNGQNGQDPQGNLLEDSAGNLYGTTVLGGLGNLGSVFELPAGSLTISSVASFDGLHNGAAPIGGLTTDGLGDFFGITSAGGADGNGVIYELSPRPAAQLAFANQPLSGVTGQPLAAITVDVQDSAGDLSGGDNSAVTLSLASGTAGALAGTLTVNAIHGVATFDNVILNAAGPCSIAATDGSLLGAVTNTITIGLLPDHLAVSTQPQDVATDAVAPSVVIAVENSNKDLVTSDESVITLTIASGPAGASLGGTTTVNAVNGLATFNNLIFSAGGTYTLAASSASYATTTTSAFVVSPPGAHLVFAQQPIAGTAGVRSNSPVIVNLLGADNNLQITGRAILVTLLVTDPNGRVSRISAITRHGVATFRPLVLRTSGTYFLRAASSKIASENSQAFSISPGVARRMVIITSPPLSTTVNTAFAVQAKLVDAFGNIATQDSSIVTASFARAPRLAVLGGGTSTAAISGIATFSNLSVSLAGRNDVLRLLDQKIQTTSRPFTVR